MKVDLYNHEQRYKNWKAEAIKKDYCEPELSKANSKLLVSYVLDMERGANVSLNNKKGSRSFARLNTIRQKISQTMRLMQIENISKVTEKQVQDFFLDMRNGTIKTQQGEKYKSTADSVKIFKSFWHWHIKVSRKQGKVIDDITMELDSSREEKPRWVYLDEAQMQKLLDSCEPKYKPFLTFLYDSGSRPTEALSLLVQDIHVEKGEVYASIRQETSKTFARKIKLLLSGKDLLEYIKRSELKQTDILFSISPAYINRYLGKFAANLFGDGESKAGAKYSDMSMYDLRHCSACYWVQRYKNSASMQYRFGWKSEKFILYYTEFLGMRDLIQTDDLFVDSTKAELQKELEAQGEEITLLKKALQKVTAQKLKGMSEESANKIRAVNPDKFAQIEKMMNELFLEAREKLK